MKKVYARYNWFSKWIAECPVCGKGVCESVSHGKPFICSRCYPGIHQTMQVIGPKNRIITIPDDAARNVALQKAMKDDALYEVIFPEDEEKIMTELRKREAKNMNLMPGETLEDIIIENVRHGIS